MDRKLTFLYASISDVVDTIRAIDNKLIALIVVLILPLTQIDVLVAAYGQVFTISPTVGWVLLFLSISSWVISAYFSGVGILSVGNPMHFVLNDKNAKGIFYGVSQNDFSKSVIAFGGKQGTLVSLSAVLESHKLGDKQIFKELVFEKMKLVCIRDLKIIRQRLALLSLGFHIIVNTPVLIISCCWVLPNFP